jgi:hypothetical protein
MGAAGFIVTWEFREWQRYAARVLGPAGGLGCRIEPEKGKAGDKCRPTAAKGLS